MKSLACNLSALTFLFTTGHGTAEVIYSGLQNTPIPLTYAGTYLDVDGVHLPAASPFTGWDINPFLGGAYLSNSAAFQPARVGTDGMDTVINFAGGATISATGLHFATGSGGSLDHLGNGALQFHDGQQGYLGFQLNGTNYGWMRVVFTDNTGLPVVKDWAYETTTGTGAAIATGNVLQSGSTVTLDSSTRSFSIGTGSPIGGSNSVIKTGLNTVTIIGTNGYAGTTSVNAGTLLVNGSITGAGAVTVVGGATLGGTGSIAGPVTVDGILAPGASIPGESIQSLATGALTFRGGSTFAYEMDSGAAASVAGDLQQVFGDLTLSGTVTLSLTDVASTPQAFTVGTTLSLIHYADNRNSGFFTYAGSTLTNGEVFTAGLNQWQINYDAINGGLNFSTECTGGHFVTLTAVPEPGSWLALGCLIGSGALLRRRRR